jgi:hypothetical protein
MSKADPLGVRQHDPLTRWREKVEQQEEEFAKARRERELEEQRERDENAVTRLRAEMQAELAAVRQQFELQGEAVGQALGEVSDQIIERTTQALKKAESELWVAIERRFGELLGRIDAIAAGEPRARSQPKDFRFSNEPREVTDDLPSPLLRKTTVN